MSSELRGLYLLFFSGLVLTIRLEESPPGRIPGLAQLSPTLAPKHAV